MRVSKGISEEEVDSGRSEFKSLLLILLISLGRGGVGRSQKDARGVDEKMGKGQTSNKDRDSIYYCV